MVRHRVSALVVLEDCHGRAQRGAAAESQRGLLEAAAFQWVNPKAWLVCAGAVGTYYQTGAGNAVGQSVSLALLFIVAALPSCFVWLAAGASVQRFLRTERAARIFNVTMGALLAGSILLFIWSPLSGVARRS